MKPNWLGDVKGKKILCLASAGGQQAPILAAAGAEVTVFDISDKQLEQDRMVAQRDGLSLLTVQGDMRDLSMFADGTFDCIFHPISNLYVPDMQPTPLPDRSVSTDVYCNLRDQALGISGHYIFDHDDRLKLR